jgi:SAM-dependent methyltransferase
MAGEQVDPLVNARRTGYARPGFAARYHAYRPRPPLAVVDLLRQLAQAPRPDLVVDLGSGTGLSTVVWAAHAERVVGIEPLDEMRGVAEANRTAANVRFAPGVAGATGLADGAADIVTCAQSLHDMEPQGTLTEVARLLRPGGVFAAYDYDWPPVVHRGAAEAFSAFARRIGELRKRHGIRSEMQQWDKAGHLERMRACGHFRYVREMHLYNTEPCTAERWVGFALTLGHVPPVLELGLDDDEVGLTALREAAQRIFGAGELPWYVSYGVRVGVK